MYAMHDRTIALADCNNFFVSCERRVCPELAGRPVIVLSSNDGCVISRSDEAKQLGIKMCAPYFEIKNMPSFSSVAVRSTNMELYREISAEVIDRLRSYTDTAEVYSIDESFLNMAIASVKDPVLYCREIRSDILRNCGIPVSIGIAPTKTLVKLGTEYAKKMPQTGGVFWVDRSRYKDPAFMAHFRCKDVWGIGGRTSEKLGYYGISTAADIISRDDVWIRKKFGLPGLYCLWELRGEQAYPIADIRKPQKSVMVSRSFGVSVTDKDTLLDALLCFTAAAAAQLRKSKQSASHMDIFISTSRFIRDKYYSNSCGSDFPDPVCVGSYFMSEASVLLSRIFVDGYEYKKCGVILSKLSDTSAGTQTLLFSDNDSKKTAAEAAADTVNRHSGAQVVKPAVLFTTPGKQRRWGARSEFRSSQAAKNALPDRLRFQCHAEDYTM